MATYYWCDDIGDHDFENPSPGTNWRTAAGVAAGTGTGLTFTAVAATDICTSAGHAIVAGRAIRLTTTTTLPAGLALATTYYVGAVTTDTFKLYSTAAKAVAGSTDQVDITDTGTGTHTITPLIYPGAVQADDIVFPSYAAGAPSVAMNQASNINGITNVTVEDGYAYAIGTRENPLYLKVAGSATWSFNCNDHGDIWIVSGTAAITALNILKTASSVDALHLAFSHAVTTANITGGTVWFDDALFGVSSAGVATLNTSRQSGGSEPNLWLLAPVTTGLDNFGAKIYWNAGTIANLENFDGIFTCEESVTARILTASTCYGGTVDLRTGVPGKITLTAAIAYKGGNIYFDVGESLQRS